MKPSVDRLTLDVYLNDDGVLSTMAEDVRRGVTASPKTLPSKYFYDAPGSELFEQITELPEYYQTRTEFAILQSIADELVTEFEFGSLLELGSGSATKTRTLLDAMERHGLLREYAPMDVSEQMLRESSERLLAQYPSLRIHGIVGDFQVHLLLIPPSSQPRLTIFLGGTIGNLDVAERQAFLSQTRDLLGEGDALLIGVDLVKDPAVLEAAYNDSAGVTAEFNRNILRAVNAALGADFVPEAYRHHAPYNRELQRIEMHLIPEEPQRVRVSAIDLAVDVEPSESIRTEISCKFTEETVTSMLASAGFRLRHWYTDGENRFALALAVPD